MDDLLKEAKEAFELASEAESDNRDRAIDDIRFARLGEQWPEVVKKERELEGRPMLTINRLPSFIRQVVNDCRQNKPSIKVHPVDDTADPQTADILSGLIRNIEATSNADIAYDTAVESAVSGGWGYFRIGIDYASDDVFDLDLQIQRVPNPFSVYGDPHSTAADSSDWNSAFVVDLMSKADFERQYKADPVDWSGDAYSDLAQPWMEGEKVLVAEWWRREQVKKMIYLLSDGTIVDEEALKESAELFAALGVQVVNQRESLGYKVTQHILTGAEVIESNDWAGRYIPIIPVYGEELNVEGERIFLSMIHAAKDPQRMLNYWRTTSTELVALAPRVPFIGPRGAFVTDARKWATANKKNHAYIEYDGATPPQRQPLDSGTAAGAMQEALAAQDDLKSIMGVFDAALGARSNETSGKAIIARQRESDNSTFHFVDNLSRAIRHAGRVLIDLIPHVYSGERIIRVLGKDETPQNVPIGKPVEMPDGTSRVFDLALGKYDVTVSAGPSYTTKREEAAEQMTAFIQAFPASAPILGDLLAKNLDWPGADEVARRLQAMVPQQAQGGNPEMDGLQQELGKAKQELQAAKQDKSLEAHKLQIDAYNAETNRLKVVGMGAEQVQALVMQTMQQVLNSPDILPGTGPPRPPNIPQANTQPQPSEAPASGGFFVPTPTGNGV